MALSDPIVLPLTVPIDLSRTGSTLGTFSSEDSTYQLEVMHSRNARTRHTIKLTQRKIAPDPPLPSVNKEYDHSVNLTINHGRQGFSNVEIVDLAEVLVELLQTAGLIDALVQGQS